MNALVSTVLSPLEPAMFPPDRGYMAGGKDGEGAISEKRGTFRPLGTHAH